jgi:hypothetical protein
VEAGVPDEIEGDAGLWAMADLVTPMAIRVVATLRIADHVAQGLRTAPELAEAVNADPDALDRVLPHLSTEGLFTRDRSEATRTIFRRCAEAAGSTGAVFVVEKIGADGWPRCMPRGPHRWSN